jgi:hypothetical protein
MVHRMRGCVASLERLRALDPTISLPEERRSLASYLAPGASTPLVSAIPMVLILWRDRSELAALGPEAGPVLTKVHPKTSGIPFLISLW